MVYCNEVLLVVIGLLSFTCVPETMQRVMTRETYGLEEMSSWRVVRLRALTFLVLVLSLLGVV